MESFAAVLNGYIMPILLLVCGVILARRIKLYRILSPKRFIGILSDSSVESGTSPVKAMCTALAGTLGVGNIAGVATAISAGGSGAVMWMWIGAVISMSVKYGEVALAVKYRVKFADEFIGGSMYTIKHGLGKYVGRSSAKLLGGFFAVMCLVNSFVTGNIVQSNSAAAVFPSVSPNAIGILFGAGILIIALVGADKISNFTYALIPPLSGAYILLSLSVIIRNYEYLPEVMSDIVLSAFSTKAALGGASGFAVREAIRFGITRGIFSNEAGCGTAPSAHAAANTKSPHHQGCFGIFEVIADTLILCSMTAFVILIGIKKYPSLIGKFDGVPLTLEAFELVLGSAAYYIIGVSVILFAFATIIAQLYYGKVALSYFTKSKIPCALYAPAAALCAFLGAGMDVSSMWICADLVVGVMTVVNVSVLMIMRKEVKKMSLESAAKEEPETKHLLIYRKGR